MATSNLTAQRLRELLSYDQETGLFTRSKSSRSPNRYPRVGWVTKSGYLSVWVSGNKYLAHRLVWLYVTGKWPEHTVDHIDCNPLNNRFANLRDIPGGAQHQNLRRAHTSNPTRLLGVSPFRRRYRARIYSNGKTTQIGTFDSPEEAYAAYLSAKRRNHPYGTL